MTNHLGGNAATTITAMTDNKTLATPSCAIVCQLMLTISTFGQLILTRSVISTSSLSPKTRISAL
ncbi:hypothetical protein [Iningainema tapete]|uniref:Uncharacterized protein n=1 Tax=Iningainema tapete BLCC-T55 TaxID=2748662 RepID=A0A8J7BWP5_9CYAN|nr:hypothetical protein [Iningainema tapete]MBD2771303.1 hypothetical protein [Iningainema tapete BLCC-T55]